MSAKPAQAYRCSGFTLRRIVLALVISTAGLPLLASIGAVGSATAADPAIAAGAWLAEEVRGTVRVRASGQATAGWQPLQAATPLAGQSEIATGSDGVAVLGNGVDQIRLAPNSRLVLPVDEGGGLLTVIKQSLGRIFFSIGSRPDRSFEVDAPYLVVLVKGTKFTVSATYMGDSVAVTEGTVEVRAVAGGNAAGMLIGAGQTATVGAGGSSVGVGSGRTSGGDSSGQGKGGGEPQSGVPVVRKTHSEPPDGGGGEGGGEGEGGEGNGGSGGGGDGNGGGGQGGSGGDPGPGGGSDGGDPGDGGDSGGDGDHGCGHGHRGESGD